MSSDDIELAGADDLLALSKALKGFDTELRKQFHKGLRDAAKPLLPVVRQTLLETYPKRGGLAERMAKTKIRVTFATGRDPGLRLVIPGLQIKLGENYGMIRHPVYGRPGKTRREWTWVAQEIDAGSINAAVAENVGKVVPGITAIVEQTTTRLLGQLKRG